MLWMCTSETCASWSRNQPSTLSERFECTCTLKLGCMPTSRSQSPMVGRNVLGGVHVERVGMHQELGAVAVRRALPVVDLLDLHLGRGCRARRPARRPAGLPRPVRRRSRTRRRRWRGRSRRRPRRRSPSARAAGRACAAPRRTASVHHGRERLVGGELLLARALGGRGAVAQHGEDGPLDRLWRIRPGTPRRPHGENAASSAVGVQGLVPAWRCPRTGRAKFAR